MALLPMSTNRISTPLARQRQLAQLQSDQTAIQTRYDQLSSGHRVLRLGDDPSAASLAIRLTGAIDHTEQVVRNAQRTDGFQQAADNSLRQIADALAVAQGAAVEGAGSLISGGERQALAATIDETIRQLVTSGEQIFLNHRLTGGVLRSPGPLRLEGNAVVFDGNDATGRTHLGGTMSAALTPTAREALGLGEPFVRGVALSPELSRDVPISDLRGGLGIEPGLLRISDGRNAVDVDLTSAATFGDIIDQLADVTLGDRALNVTFTADAISLRYADGLGGTIAVADAAGGQTAEQLRIRSDGFRSLPLVGDGLRPRVSITSPLDRLPAANDAGRLQIDGGLRITRDDSIVEVDLSEAKTVSDVLVAINRSEAGVRATLGTGGQIEVAGLHSGADFGIGELGGTVATQLGLRTASLNTPLADLDGGRGAAVIAGQPDLTITRPDGVELALEVDPEGTIADLIEAIEAHPSNQDSRRLRASLATVGNGLVLQAPGTTGPIRVSQPTGGRLGHQLGLIPEGQSEAAGTISSGAALFSGTDFNRRPAGGAIDDLIRLKEALRDGDSVAIGGLQDRLETHFNRAVTTRGRVGIANRNVREVMSAAQDQSVLLQDQKSHAIDADLATVISELTSRQASLEASLRFVGQTAQLTVLNFL